MCFRVCITHLSFARGTFPFHPEPETHFSTLWIQFIWLLCFARCTPPALTPFFIFYYFCASVLYMIWRKFFLFFIYNQSHIGCAKGWWSQRLRIKSIFLDSPIQVMVGQEPNPAVTGQKVGPVQTGHQSIPRLIIQCAFCNAGTHNTDRHAHKISFAHVSTLWNQHQSIVIISKWEKSEGYFWLLFWL